MLIVSPILVLASVAIWIEDGGSIFYTQTRVGRNNRRFKLYKFRTMIKNAEKNGAEWSKKEDNRITKTGKILRKTHIDEIPQMINIIKGDIGVVGPRPERPEICRRARTPNPLLPSKTHNNSRIYRLGTNKIPLRRISNGIYGPSSSTTFTISKIATYSWTSASSLGPSRLFSFTNLPIQRDCFLKSVFYRKLLFYLVPGVLSFFFA